MKKLEWGDVEEFKTGGRFWWSKCRRYRITVSEECMGVELPRIYIAWHYCYVKGLPTAGARRLLETRSRKRALNCCRLHHKQRMAEA